MLHKHVDAEDIVQHAERSSSAHRRQTLRNVNSLAYGSRYATQDIPKFKLPDQSTEPAAAYQLIHDELELDGRPNSNLASFGE